MILVGYPPEVSLLNHPLKMGGWKEEDPASYYWVSATFQGQTVKISEGYLVLEKLTIGKKH